MPENLILVIIAVRDWCNGFWLCDGGFYVVKSFKTAIAKPVLYTGYLLNFKLKNMSKLYYRIAHEETQQGLWYDSKGNFTGLIHNKFNFCMNTNLQMPFDPDF